MVIENRLLRLYQAHLDAQYQLQWNESEVDSLEAPATNNADSPPNKKKNKRRRKKKGNKNVVLAKQESKAIVI